MEVHQTVKFSVSKGRGHPEFTTNSLSCDSYPKALVRNQLMQTHSGNEHET